MEKLLIIRLLSSVILTNTNIIICCLFGWLHLR